jgi:2-phosphoglycerate kinase
MNKTIEREKMITHLEEYRSYLRKLLSQQDGADISVYEFNGAIRAVNNLLKEVRKGTV